MRIISLFSLQIELEKLNCATNEINKLEIELDVSIHSLLFCLILSYITLLKFAYASLLLS